MTEKEQPWSCEEVREAIEESGGTFFPAEIKQHLVECESCYQFWEDFEREKPARLLVAGGWVYGFLLSIAAFWMFFQEKGAEQIYRTFWPGSFEVWIQHLGLGVGVGLGVVLISQVSYRLLTWPKKLERQFLRVLGRPKSWQILLFGLYSSVGEEFFFRGALQNAIGVIPAAVLFGCLHVATFDDEEKPSLWLVLAWPTFATVMGLIFAWMSLYTGSLFAPIVAHFLINSLNLWFMVRRHGL